MQSAYKYYKALTLISTSVSETTKQILTDKKVNIVWQNQYKA